jgi:NadR type nicotinamide-nucleotide adenylyltransferase
MPTLGLLLGKFAPFHRGHQHLVEHALARVSQLIILIYDSPAETRIPLPVRSAWIRELYPQAEVIEAWNAPSEVGRSESAMRAQEAYVLDLLKGRKVTHFFSSEFYGEHMSRALAALDCRVDEARAVVPVSGTAVREDWVAQRRFLHPRVRRDLVVRVALLGGPSTGKSTLAEAAAGAMGTLWMPEYGREYWETHQQGRRLEPEQLVEIALEHRRREDALAQEAGRVLFCDTNALTTRLFALDYHGSALPELERLADDCATRYDRTFVCGDEIPFDATWDRSGPGQRGSFQAATLTDLETRGIRYEVLRGSVSERVALLQQALRGVQRV